MAEGSLITEELRSLIGKEVGRRETEIEKGAIKKFAKAIDDPNPLWQDEAYAKDSKWGGIIAPPTFISYCKTDMPEINFPLKRMLHGEDDIEYYQPVRAGDTISSVCKVVDIYEKQGKKGPMIFTVLETSHMNQKDELVAKNRISIISF
ncbi:MAG: MaoC family dehydratase N-terminal domain-containing protein [Thermodesulfobacteriota bacterium]|nr:MaoC family dehydratase N-terminal domain-containing protein [Thermodesulfobacteriota bacterium]